jgi:hypothetical protein
MERRKFVQAASLLPAMGLMNLNGTEKINHQANNASKIKLSVSSYSYWHFKGDKYPIEKVIKQHYWDWKVLMCFTAKWKAKKIAICKN